MPQLSREVNHGFFCITIQLGHKVFCLLQRLSSIKKSDNLHEDGSLENNRYQKERREFPSLGVKMKNGRKKHYQKQPLLFFFVNLL